MAGFSAVQAGVFAAFAVYATARVGSSESLLQKDSAKLAELDKGTSKPVNLPSYKRVKIDMDHILSGHTASGGRATQSGIKDLFPSNMSKNQIENSIRDAYRHCKKVETQGDRVKVIGKSGDLTIEMWVNIVTKTIETAYPK